MIPQPTREHVELDAKNLLLNCARARPRDRILIVGEADDNVNFEPELCEDVAEAAGSLGKRDRGHATVGPNPNTFSDGDPLADLEYWGQISYGAPRYTHLHACSHDPGGVAFHLMDATISFDGTRLWDRGRFVFLDQPEVQAVNGEDQKEF